eukprot:COSAG06_NODE_3021_length_5950_cov_3.010938_7_plen_197_part_00
MRAEAGWAIHRGCGARGAERCRRRGTNDSRSPLQPARPRLYRQRMEWRRARIQRPRPVLVRSSPPLQSVTHHRLTRAAMPFTTLPHCLRCCVNVMQPQGQHPPPNSRPRATARELVLLPGPRRAGRRADRLRSRQPVLGGGSRRTRHGRGASRPTVRNITVDIEMHTHEPELSGRVTPPPTVYRWRSPVVLTRRST